MARPSRFRFGLIKRPSAAGVAEIQEQVQNAHPHSSTVRLVLASIGAELPQLPCLVPEWDPDELC